mmetsp:Transcript_119309/g.334189  ORF Transcript_119309/g.334189 Transcript_119309/m.334189 type:complete len:204 (+) Transcript_119309:125-736(+)
MPLSSYLRCGSRLTRMTLLTSAAARKALALSPRQGLEERGRVHVASTVADASRLPAAVQRLGVEERRSPALGQGGPLLARLASRGLPPHRLPRGHRRPGAVHGRGVRPPPGGPLPHPQHRRGDPLCPRRSRRVLVRMAPAGPPPRRPCRGKGRRQSRRLLRPKRLLRLILRPTRRSGALGGRVGRVASAGAPPRRPRRGRGRR